jgi:hypothetical protein
MNRVFLSILAVAFLALSCGKTVKAPVSYSVTNDATDSLVQDVFIPDTGNWTMSVRVKFLNGYQGDNDKITLVLKGLPDSVSVTPDTFVAIPSFVEDFVFHSRNAKQGVYPATLTSYTDLGTPHVYNFNIHVIPADCAALYWGSLTGTSLCTSRSYTHTATGTTGGTNILMINNFGGYGVNCDARVILNCDNDSLHIPAGFYGNGVVMEGKGVFNATTMIIEYTATAIPGGGSESCTITYTR